jgi:pimeloyl-ACP methyl ester carboxylesterase
MSSMRTLHVLFTSALATLLTLTVAHAAELPPGVKMLQVNGYDMAYVERGSGGPLVMVHGAMSDYRHWAAQMEPLSQSNRAIAVSLRHYFPERWDGKGGSFSWKQHVADLISFIKALDAGPIGLLGHSRGGLVAVEVALTEPGLVRSLILAEPGLILDESGGFGSTLQENAAARTAATERADRIKSVLNRFQAGDIDGGLEIFVEAVGGAGSWKERPETQRQILRDNAWTIKGMEEEQRRPVSCGDLKGLNMPVLLVGGEKSPPRYGEILTVIEPCLKNRARVTIPNASHGMNRINPAAFNNAVAQFLSAH